MAGWFDAREAQQFGATLADFLMERIPPAAVDNSEEFVLKRQEALHKMRLQIEVFQVDHKLNLFKKAKFGNAFKWKLLDAGYPAEFADHLTRALLLRM